MADVKIGDLGFSRSVKSMSKALFPETIHYMSPEIVEQDANYNEKIDVW
jgi:serine/threonine protein kinase